MAVEHAYYTISHRADGWHAGQMGLPSERVFADKDAALKWCRQQAEQASASAAPEAGTYSDADAEIEYSDDE